MQIYIIGLLLCTLLSVQAARSDKTSYVWLIVTLLTLIAGLRSYNCGLDTYGYLQQFELISEGRFAEVYAVETSYKYIVYALTRLTDNYTLFLCLMALITNGLIIFRLWDFKEISSFPCMVLCYYASFYFMTFNGVRQFCAVAIVFYFSRCLDKNKILQFLLGIVIASLFHQSAVLGVLFLLPKFADWRRLPRGEKLILILFLLSSPLLIHYALPSFSRYERYLKHISLDFGIMIPVKLYLFFILLIFIIPNYKIAVRNAESRLTEPPCDVYVIPSVCIYYFLGLAFAALGYVFHLLDRVSWYFYIFEGVYFGFMLKDKRRENRAVFGTVMILLIGFGFVYSLTHNSQGNVPYYFFWQQ